MNRSLKFHSIFLGLTLIISGCTTSTNKTVHEISIIPKPQSVVTSKGSFSLNENTTLHIRTTKETATSLSNYIVTEIKKQTGLTLKQQLNGNSTLTSNTLQFVLDSENLSELEKDAYILEASSKHISIKANTPSGLFYGFQSLLQLLPIAPEKTNQYHIPACTIQDPPRFQWRGMHLDVARRFYSVEFIKKYIDYLAMNKLNVFHWHLTEDQGWRIEIKKYPKLTEVGAQRKETAYDGKPYEGHYTQEEIKNIVAYAKERYVTIVPEIELPGHSVAALAAYPEISCTGGPFEVVTNWGIFKDVYCAGNEETFTFLQDVLDEAIALFPSEYIHIGGDEVPKDRWEHCNKCQQRIKDEHLKNEHELQSYFVQRIEKYINSKGKKIIGWDEILEGGLAPNATVMSWRGEEGGIAAAKQNHDVVMSPGDYLYFNYFQGNNPDHEPNTIGRKLTLSKVYNYNPTPNELTPEESKHIIGAQACLWSERIPDSNEAEYMLFPRIAALAEVVWTQPEHKDKANFMKRLYTTFDRYDELGINYAKSVLNPYAEVQTFKDSLQVSLATEIENGRIYYTLDGSIPDSTSTLYKSPIILTKTTLLRAQSYFESGRKGQPLEENLILHKALKKEVKLTHDFSERYPGGPNTLTDGLTASKSYGDGRWQGILQKDFEAMIDLGQNTRINKVSCNFLHFPEGYIFSPKSIALYVSDNGTDYKKIDEVFPKEKRDPMEKTIIPYSFTTGSIEAQYLKVYAKNMGVNPPWHKTAGDKSWLLIDEIIVE